MRPLVEDEEPGTKLLPYDKESYIAVDEAMGMWFRVSGKPVSFVEMSEGHAPAIQILDGPAHIEEFGSMAGAEGWLSRPS